MALILVGVAVMLAYMMLVGARSRLLPFATAVALATVVGIILLLFITFSYPFSGDIAVDASVFEDQPGDGNDEPTLTYALAGSDPQDAPSRLRSSQAGRDGDHGPTFPPRGVC